MSLFPLLRQYFGFLQQRIILQQGAGCSFSGFSCVNSAESHISTLVCSVLCHAQKPLFHVVFTLSPGSVLNQVKGF